MAHQKKGNAPAHAPASTTACAIPSNPARYIAQYLSPYHTGARLSGRRYILRCLHLALNSWPLKHSAAVSNIQHGAQLASQTPRLELASQTPRLELASQTPAASKRYKHPVASKHYKHPFTGESKELARQGESKELAAAGKGEELARQSKGEELARQSKGEEQRARVSLTNSASPVSISKPRGIRPLSITTFPIGEPGNREARMISQAYVTDRLSLSVRSGPADTDTDHDQGADTDTYPDQVVIRIRIMIKPRYGCESRSGKKFP